MVIHRPTDDILQYDRARHTNIWYPNSNYVTYNTYPDQDQDMIGSIVTLRYRNMNYVDLSPEELGPVDSLSIDKNNIFTGEFIVLRFDTEEPFRMISISTDYEVILINDSRYYMVEVNQYAIQYNEFIGIEVFDDYGVDKRPAVTLRVDNGEPCMAVIAEFVGPNKFRFILGDEVACHMSRYTYAIDINGHTAPDTEERTNDVDGGPPDYGMMSFIVLDGGLADMLRKIYDRNISDMNVVEIREQILKETIDDYTSEISPGGEVLK